MFNPTIRHLHPPPPHRVLFSPSAVIHPSFSEELQLRLRNSLDQARIKPGALDQSVDLCVFVDGVDPAFGDTGRVGQEGIGREAEDVPGEVPVTLRVGVSWVLGEGMEGSVSVSWNTITEKSTEQGEGEKD